MPQTPERKRIGWAASIAKGLCPMCAKRPRGEHHKWCAECRERQSALVKERRQRFRDAGLCYQCGKDEAPAGKRCERCCEVRRKWNEKNRETAGRGVKRRVTEVRLQAIAAYGGKCVCCGEAQPYFLTFDHINNDGSAHRTEIGRNTQICYWLRDRGYPADIVQLLCWNCNAAKFYYGGGICPHQIEGFAMGEPTAPPRTP